MAYCTAALPPPPLWDFLRDPVPGSFVLLHRRHGEADFSLTNNCRGELRAASGRDRHDLNIFQFTFAVHEDCVSSPLEQQIDRGFSAAEIANGKLGDSFRKKRPVKQDSPLLSLYRNAKAALQNKEWSGGAPGLGRARDRIEGRTFCGAPFKATEQFWKALKVDFTAEIEQGEQDLAGEFLMSELCHAVGDDGVVMRPYGAIMVGERVVAGLGAGNGTNTPTGEQVGAHEGLGDPASAFGGG